MTLNNGWWLRRRVLWLAVFGAALIGCSTDSDANQTARSDTTTDSGETTPESDVGVDVERLYRMYFADAETFEPADVEFEIDMALRGYRAASECMEESGRDYEIPSRASIRDTLYSAEVVAAKQGATATTNIEDEGDPAAGAAALTPECSQVQTAERDRIEAALEPYMEPLADAFAAVDTDPRVVEATQQWSDCMTEAGFRYSSRAEYLETVGAMDPGPEQDGLRAADEGCYAEPGKEIEAVQDEASQKFNEEYRAAILETLSSLDLS